MAPTRGAVGSALGTRCIHKDCHLKSHYKWDPTANECTFWAKIKAKSTIAFAHFLLDERPLCNCEKFRSCPFQKQLPMPIAHLCGAEHWCWHSNFGVKQHTSSLHETNCPWRNASLFCFMSCFDTLLCQLLPPRSAQRNIRCLFVLVIVRHSQSLLRFLLVLSYSMSNHVRISQNCHIFFAVPISLPLWKARDAIATSSGQCRTCCNTTDPSVLL